MEFDRAETEWAVVDHDADDRVVRAGFATSAEAALIRQELESTHSYFKDNGNLWVVERVK